MAILVFGGLGHVGSWVAHDLLARGEEVAIFDSGVSRFGTPDLDHLKPYQDRLRLEESDVLDVHGLYAALRRYEGGIDTIVFGIAAVAGPAFSRNPNLNIRINTEGFLNVLEAARLLGVPKLVNLSSGAVYGDHKGAPDETVPPAATDLYAATKVANEVFAGQYAASFGMDIRTARLFAVYGPGKRPSRMYPFYQALFGPLEGMRGIVVQHGGDQSMDWTHVRDTAAGIVQLLDAEGVAGRTFNISTGIAVPHREIVEAVAEIVGEDCHVGVGPGSFITRATPLDVSAAKRELGFSPRFGSIRDGLNDYRNWLLRPQRLIC